MCRERDEARLVIVWRSIKAYGRPIAWTLPMQACWPPPKLYPYRAPVSGHCAIRVEGLSIISVDRRIPISYSDAEMYVRTFGHLPRADPSRT